MLKKTTLYLEDEDVYLLKKLSVLKNMTIAETVRLAIRNFCKPAGKIEEKMWKDLDKLWAKTSSIETDTLEKAVNNAVKEVRRGKKTRSHS